MGGQEGAKKRKSGEEIGLSGQMPSPKLSRHEKLTSPKSEPTEKEMRWLTPCLNWSKFSTVERDVQRKTKFCRLNKRITPQLTQNEKIKIERRSLEKAIEDQKSKLNTFSEKIFYIKLSLKNYFDQSYIDEKLSEISKKARLSQAFFDKKDPKN